VQQEGVRPRDHLRVLADDPLEPLRAFSQGALESRRRLVDARADEILLLNQIGIRLSHH